MRAHFGDIIFQYFLQNQSHVTLYYHQTSHDLRRFIQNWHHDWLIEERALANELMIGKLLPTEVSSASYQVQILVFYSVGTRLPAETFQLLFQSIKMI